MVPDSVSQFSDCFTYVKGFKLTQHELNNPHGATVRKGMWGEDLTIG